ncbi:protein phosphatase 1 regulatory subunit 42-like [Aethina tumida]|uniref:protein phosphatase 1 regulatory subunit 42-like n=1 Tax=Aethina tumida TaxID=116153 RepID=UPI002148FB86|nr:protein phosphatase 1 regulatory subunit 42-like [Aethina tumida]
MLEEYKFTDNLSTTKKKMPKRYPTKFRRITHLHMQEKGLYKINNIVSSEVEVLYLFGNKITCIENLENMPNLASLYLQRNYIEKITNLTNLKNLKNLYLSRNYINVLEGLDDLKKLEELHIEKQNLDPEDCFCFDPRTIYKISGTLRVLNLSGNRITTIKYLAPLVNLEHFDISDNELECLQELSDILPDWTQLTVASFKGNPLTRIRRYRDTVIANCYKLQTLDDKNITDVSRTFIKRLEEEKLFNKRSRKTLDFSTLIPGVPNNYPHTLHKAISASILKNNFNDLSFDETPTQYIPWKQMPKPSAPKRKPNKVRNNTVGGHFNGINITNYP